MLGIRRYFRSACGLALLVAAPFLAAASPDDVTGLWRDDGSILLVRRVDDVLHAQLIALRPGEINYGDGEQGSWAAGSARRDDQNPDESLRSRFLMGMQLLSNYQFNKGVWQGEIYDPGSGNTYSSTMKINRRGELQMRGYIGISLFGRTVTYSPFDPCAKHGLHVGEQFAAAVICSMQSGNSD